MAAVIPNDPFNHQEPHTIEQLRGKEECGLGGTFGGAQTEGSVVN